MGMKSGDTILGPARGTEREFWLWAGANHDPTWAETDEAIVDYIQEVYRLAPLVGIDPAIVIAQSAVETGNWTSDPWQEWLNPAGIGITYKGQDPGYRWKNGADAARAHLAHLLTYALGPSDAGSRWYRTVSGFTPLSGVNPRYEAYLAAYGNVAKAETIAGLAGTWAVDLDYAAKIANKGNLIFPNLPNQKEQSMAEYRTVVPGLSGGALVTTYPIRMNMIAVDGYQRTGQKARTPRRSVQHGTGNPSNASAMAEAQYFVNGAEGRQASVHACSDDKEIVICMPLDEVAWHAADGGGPGNMNGYACEMMEAVAIWANPTRRDALIRITADFMGRVAARFGVTKPERHWDFNGRLPPAQRHHCPDKLMDTGLWETSYVPKWHTARVDELARMQDGTPSTTTTAAPVQYPEGLDEGVATWIFGDDTGYTFNPDGPVSQAWLTYGKARGYSRLVDVWKLDDGREYWTFGSMTLWRPNTKTAFAPLGGA